MPWNKTLTSTAWIVHVLIVFEILFMISPFALYFYASYGPALNTLHLSPATAWLTSFYLPHVSHTASPLLQAVKPVAYGLVYGGLLLFAVGFVHIYGSKLLGRGAVTGGLYRYVRHPQYVALAILGLGTTLLWPRFLVLIMYVSMLFLYVALASHEEALCERKFGDDYRAYRERTGRFLPRSLESAARLPRWWPSSRRQRWMATAAIYLATVGVACGLALGLRHYSLGELSALFQDDAAILSPAVLETEVLRDAYRTALDSPQVRQTLSAADPPAKYLVYVLPREWHLADLPLDPLEVVLRFGGHYTPADFDSQRFKLLFTRVKSHAPSPSGRRLITRTYGRDPLLLAEVDLEARKVTAVSEPPPHVIWGDIPTPLF